MDLFITLRTFVRVLGDEYFQSRDITIIFQ